MFVGNWLVVRQVLDPVVCEPGQGGRVAAGLCLRETAGPGIQD